MLLLSGNSNSGRLQFAAEFIFSQWAGMTNWRWIEPDKISEEVADIKLYYGNNAPEGWVEISPHSIMKEGFKDKISLGIHKKDEAILAFPSNNSWGFDPFAYTFWFLSRYEEYGEAASDKHGRFPYEASAFAAYGIDEHPLLDEALQYFFKCIGVNTDNKLTIEPTLDIDMAFKFFGKPRWRLWSGLIRHGLKGEENLISQWIEVKTSAEDPFNNFDYQEQLCNQLGFVPLYFFHVGGYGKYDKSIPTSNEEMQQIIKQCERFGRVGVHPSYHTMDTEGLLEKEKLKLEELLGRTVVESRQHYLRFKLPLSYRRLLKAGILHDYSMGFADNSGFRAGTSHPFYFYDIDLEQQTNLCIHPFSFMDVTVKNRLNLQIGSAISKLERIKGHVKKCGGVFSFIFHNESLSNTSGWTGWRAVFEKSLEL